MTKPYSLCFFQEAKTSFLFVFLALFSLISSAQSVGFIENKGQWAEEISAKYHLSNGVASFINNEVRLSVIEPNLYAELEHEAHDHPETSVVGNGHTYSMRFGSNYSTIDFYSRHKDYVNYFIGNKSSKWASRVGVYDKMMLREAAEGIDVAWEIKEGHIKYTLEVSSRAELEDFSISYDAVRALRVENGALKITLPNHEVIEQEPIAFQLIGGEKQMIDCAFKVNGHKASFQVGEYNHQYMLFIDPVVVASTNSGSQVNTWGHSATYDQFGNIYGAGRPFGTGFPVDTGSFQMDFGGGGVDIGLCKMNEDGSQLLWSTYIGGSSDEYAHSLVVNGFNQIIVYGQTNSPNYPVSPNAFDTSYNGQQDIIVTILSDSGDALIGSTYLGGEGDDGKNVISVSYAGFKGEVETDIYSNIYVASTTKSDTFPVSNNAFQLQRDSLQDGVIVKLNFNASTMLAGTYLGGFDDDAVFGVKPMKNGDVVVTGSTKSSNFISTIGAELDSFQGTQDAFLTRFDSELSVVVSSTFIRTDTTSVENGLFVQVDRDGAIYILGSSNAIVADTNRYSGPSSGSYIRKYSPMLDSLHWTSTFTSLSHSAFLVDNCKNIYAGGNGPSTVDLTPNAVQTSPGGFYIMVLNSEADSLIHGTHYGSGSHVDGGTSRFDKRGAVYQATCSSGAFPLTPNAYSGNQNGGTYDLTLFKIDFEVESAVASAQAASGYVGCAPFEVDFTNYGSQGIAHFWDFGDNGDTALIANPSHTFETAGTYEITYVVTDTVGCFLTDTARIVITVADSANNSILIGDTTCVTNVTLEAGSGFGNYLWSNGETNFKINVNISGQYWVAIDDVCGVFVDTIELNFSEPYVFELQDDTAICELNFDLVGPIDADSFLWSTGDTTQNIQPTTTGKYFLTAMKEGCSYVDSVNLIVSVPTFTQSDTLACADSLVLSVSTNPGIILWNTGDTTENISVFQSGFYSVILSNGTCVTTDSINVTLGIALSPLAKDSVICRPEIISAFDADALGYLWSTGDTTSAIDIEASGEYWVVRYANVCSDTDTVNIVRHQFSFDEQLQLVCDEDSASLFANASPSWKFLWSNGDTTQQTTIYSSGEYWVNINSGSCLFSDTLASRFIKSIPFDLGGNVELCKGERLTFNLDSIDGNFFWSTGDTSKTTVVTDSGLLWLSIVRDGCEIRDSLNVSWRNIDSASFTTIANVITPNGDGINDKLSFYIANEDLVKSFSLSVFNRWGSLIFESKNQNISWDGTTNYGEKVPSGTYFYSLDCETYCVEKGTITVRETVTVLD
ncbi:MAG: gliding motility-associated C-terminal domain-containing protein [Salibacteraceae bacterium]|nr:gliding motility-associated C-terminal domain-containing protein [Salibacteraceae bacterium]